MPQRNSCSQPNASSWPSSRAIPRIKLPGPTWQRDDYDVPSCSIAKAWWSATIAPQSDIENPLGLSSLTRSRGAGEPSDTPSERYFVEHLTIHSNAWMVKSDDEEHGPYKSQAEAALFASNAEENSTNTARRRKRAHLDLRPRHQPRVVVSCAASMTLA